MKNLTGAIFYVPTAECRENPPVPYRYRVLRRHRDIGFWECVCEAGGHPARHGSICIYASREIYERNQQIGKA